MPFKALPLSLLAAVLLSGAGPRTSDVPLSAVSLSMPSGGLDLSIGYRQIGTDLRPYLEGSGLDAAGLRKLQVSALLSQGGRLAADMELLAGGVKLPPGRYAFGFTVGPGEQMHFFLAHGEQVVPLPSEALQPGWTSDRLLLQLVYVRRNETHLVWHLGPRAGRIVLRPGGEPPSEPPAGDDPAPDDDDAPRR